MTKRISKALVINGETIVSESDWNAELEAKHLKACRLAARAET